MKKIKIIVASCVLTLGLCGCGADTNLTQAETGVSSTDAETTQNKEISQSTEIATEDENKVQLDTSNPNYEEWSKGIYCEVASVPDKGMVHMYKNDYRGGECGYMIEVDNKDDFDYLVKKYQNEGFDENEDVDDDKYSAFSGNNYISLHYSDSSNHVMVTLSSGDKYDEGWEKGICSGYLKKPDFGECHLMENQFLDDPYSSYKFYDVTKEQAEKYIDTCKNNGYEDAPDQDSEDGYDIYWTGNATDGKSWISIKHNIDENSMDVYIISLEN